MFFFSVVIPLFNKEKYIRRAVDSVLAQTYDAFELVVVDDGSDDHSLIYLESYKDTRFRVISQPNRGVSVARNTGIQATEHPYIALLDADDAWEPEFLETMVRLITNFPNAGMYLSAYKFVKQSTGRVKYPSFRGVPNEGWEGYVPDYFKSFQRRDLAKSSSVCVPRFVFDDVGRFAPGVIHTEDSDMWVRIAEKYKVVFSWNYLSKVYAVPQNTSQSTPPQKKYRVIETLHRIAIETSDRNRKQVLTDLILILMLDYGQRLLQCGQSAIAKDVLYDPSFLRLFFVRRRKFIRWLINCVKLFFGKS